MIRRIFLAALGLLAFTGAANAHKLEVGYRLLPGLRVQVHGRYEGGDPASGARVKVVAVDGRTVREGRLDKYGIFTFEITDAKELNITVSIVGHRAEAMIGADILRRHILAYCSACIAPQPLPTAALLELQSSIPAESTRSALPSDVPSNFPTAGMLIGVGVLLITAIVFQRLAKRKAG